MIRKHRLPLGTRVAFEGDSHVYQIADYQIVLECPPDCKDDHDCFPEPYVCVSKTVHLSKPLSQLRCVFDNPNGFGRKPELRELTLEQEKKE